MKNIAILIPAHNEELVISKTLESVCKIVSQSDIYVVSDGSKDKTATIAKEYTENVLDVQPNRGKATAMNLAIEYFNLSKNYEYIMPMDADTEVDKNFIHESLKYFDQNSKNKIVCVVGKVVGRSDNWTTSYRLWEYEITQIIHKAAQDKEQAIMVCPGCATVYKAKIFDKVKIPLGTLTEDMDFTFLIHRKHLGRIAFCPTAFVITQDPKSLKDLLKQFDRWYTGFWQCVLKHNIPWKGQMLDIEVGLLALEGLFNGLLIIFLLILVPIVLIKNPQLLLVPFLVDFFLFMLPSVLFICFKFKTIKVLLYLPFLYFMRVFSSLVFLKSFVKIILKLDLTMKWNKALRYQRKDLLWPNLSRQ